MPRKQIRRSEVNRKAVIEIWRKSGNPGRLRWRDKNPADYGWQRYEIAMTISGAARTFYETYDAILDDCGYDVID